MEPSIVKMAPISRSIAISRRFWEIHLVAVTRSPKYLSRRGVDVKYLQLTVGGVVRDSARRYYKCCWALLGMVLVACKHLHRIVDGQVAKEFVECSWTRDKAYEYIVYISNFIN